MTPRQYGWLILALLLPTAWLLWLDVRPSPTASGSTAPAGARAPGGSKGTERAAVATLLSQDTSAYDARLWADEDAAVLVTPSGVSVFRPDVAPEEHPLDLGPIAARQGAAIVFWRAGNLRRVSLSGAQEHVLAALPHPPQYLLASDSELAWIGVRRGAGSSLHALSAGAARLVYQSPDRACAAVLHGSQVYWVLQSRDGSWRVGRIALDGQHPVVTASQRGRPPAALVAGPDGIYFYAGPERGVRRLTFDLKREDIVVANTICSPLAVSSRLICAQVGGLLDVVADAEAPRLLALERAGPITALAATHDRAFWVVESGEARLSVKSVALAGR